MERFTQRQRFVEKHLRNVPKQLRVLILEGHRLYPTHVDLNVLLPSIEFSDALSLEDYNNSEEKVYLHTVFHCDGLLLCTTTEGELVVWNPCLRETRWIKHNNGSTCFLEMSEFVLAYQNYQSCRKGITTKFALGYENNQFSRSYKILMFWGCDKTEDGCEIYDFNSNAWRVVNARPNCLVMSSHGVTLKGNTYWVSSNHYLLSFDFTEERFIRLCFPLTSHDSMYMALSVVREELSVLRCIRGSSKIEMWVTTNKMDSPNCEADLSWSKSFEVDYGFDVYTCLLIDERKKVALCVSDFRNGLNGLCTVGEKYGYYTEILFKEKVRPHIFNYVPSLVHIQQDVESDVFACKSPRRRWDDDRSSGGGDDSEMWEYHAQFQQEIDDMNSAFEEGHWWEMDGTDFSTSRKSRGRGWWKTR